MLVKNIQSRIHEVRNQRVMFDFDLAALYEVETRGLKQAVKRNLDRFPEDFMFQLTKTEWQELITNCDNLPQSVKFSPALPLAFTEQGVAMLSSVLKSKKALQVNISIMRAFVVMKQYIVDYAELSKKMTEIETKYNKQFADVYEALNYLMGIKKEEEKAKKRKLIGFK
ncbi:MAG: ORF6N domain-containing protein [Bacteroidetes bacterium]|nr:ORF6N domain-containing protein [Bacteroidota bacterium]